MTTPLQAQAQSLPELPDHIQPMAWMKFENIPGDDWDAYDFSANQHGEFQTALYSAKQVREILSAHEAEVGRLREALKEIGNMHHDLLVVMQAAWIDWQRGAGANSAMQWVHNTLMGPGLIPDDDEPYASEPQAYFDANKAEPFPTCFCGRPSNQLWMGKGFCGEAHYKEHRAALTQGETK